MKCGSSLRSARVIPHVMYKAARRSRAAVNFLVAAATSIASPLSASFAARIRRKPSPPDASAMFSGLGSVSLKYSCSASYSRFSGRKSDLVNISRAAVGINGMADDRSPSVIIRRSSVADAVSSVRLEIGTHCRPPDNSAYLKYSTPRQESLPAPRRMFSATHCSRR